ncbi:MAG: phosphate ABC transporter, permease protein PstA, partial [Nocardioides sp.]
MTTTLAPPTPRPRVRTGGVNAELVLHVVSAAAGALALVWLMYQRMLPISGTIGFWLSWYVVFLVLLAAASATTLDKMAVIDRLVGAVVTTAGLILVACLVGIVVFTAIRGWDALTHTNFYTETTAFIGPEAPLNHGGIYAAMVGTLEQVAISMLLSVPLGIATAVYLSEVRGSLARVVRTVVEAMSAVPTIVAGLFVYSMLILTLGKMELPPKVDAVVTTLGLGDRSGFAASIALSVSMIPVVVTTAEVVLRLVPGGLREAS